MNVKAEVWNGSIQVELNEDTGKEGFYITGTLVKPYNSDSYALKGEFYLTPQEAKQLANQLQEAVAECISQNIQLENYYKEEQEEERKI